jgi:phosphate transport system permease protein
MATVTTPVDAGGAAVLRTASGRRRTDTTMRWVFLSAALTTFAVTVAIITILAVDAWDFFSRVDKSALWGQIGWFPRRGLFDIPTLVVGTLVVTVIAMIVAVPLGIGAAIYLSEYAKPHTRRVLKPVLEVLAGIPSVVLGFFAISFINPNLVRRFFDQAQAANLAAAAVAVGVLSVPIIASVAEDALRAVPMSLREASYGLGARRSATAFRVVFPAAVSGIIAALVLGMSRAIGETMVVAIAAGATGGSLFHFDPLLPGQTMTAAMASLGFGSDQVAGDNLAFQSLYFVGALLFLLTLLLNFVGDRLVRRIREEY